MLGRCWRRGRNCSRTVPELNFFIARWKRWLHFVIPGDSKWATQKLPQVDSVAWGSFVWNLVIFSGKKKGRLPDESHQSQNLCSLWLQTSAMCTQHPQKNKELYTYSMFLYTQINYLHEWQKDNKIKTKGPSMRTFSMPISIPWTSTAMSALQFQMIFKSNSSPSYLKPKTPWQIWLQFLKKTSQKRQNEDSPSANYHMFIYFQHNQNHLHFSMVLLHLDSMSGNWFCFPCATPISRISGCFSPKEKVLKETVPKTEGKASCHIKWFVMKSSRRKNTTFPGALQKSCKKSLPFHDMFFLFQKNIFSASFCGMQIWVFVGSLIFGSKSLATTCFKVSWMWGHILANMKFSQSISTPATSCRRGSTTVDPSGG